MTRRAPAGRRFPTPFDLLVVWHGLFAGAWLVAYVSGDAWEGLHAKAGYILLGLLAIRLAVALVVPAGSVWRLPRVSGLAWRSFRSRLMQGELKILGGRTPLTPAAALAVLGAAGLAALSGLIAWFGGADDPHEALAQLSLLAVGVHVGTVLLPALLRVGRERITG